MRAACYVGLPKRTAPVILEVFAVKLASKVSITRVAVERPMSRQLNLKGIKASQCINEDERPNESESHRR